MVATIPIGAGSEAEQTDAVASRLFSAAETVK